MVLLERLVRSNKTMRFEVLLLLVALRCAER